MREYPVTVRRKPPSAIRQAMAELHQQNSQGEETPGSPSVSSSSDVVSTSREGGETLSDPADDTGATAVRGLVATPEAAAIGPWLNEDGPGQTASMAELWPRICAEVAAADEFVLYVELEDLPLKGAFIEAGVALAHGKKIRIVCPRIDGARAKLLGSWVSHPNVTFHTSLYEVFALFRRVTS